MKGRTRCAAGFLSIFVVAGTSPVAGLQVEEGPCEGVPSEGTWNFDAGTLQAPGAAQGLGGGVLTVVLTEEDCGQLLTAEFGGAEADELEGKRVVFARFGPEESLASWWAGYLDLIGAAPPTGLTDPSSGGSASSALAELQAELFPEGALPDPTAPGPEIYRAVENEIIDEPRIFWLLFPHTTDHLRSVVGFALVSERGADPSPPHLQFHDWTLKPSGGGEPPGRR